jgi:hypothetical protein
MRSGTGTTCNEERPQVNRRYPAGWYVFAFLSTASSLLLATGSHRAVYAVLHSVSTPSAGIAVLTGLMNLSWYEIAYAVGGGLKSVRIYGAIPVAACLTGALSGVLLLSRFRIRRQILTFHLVMSAALSALALSVLLWRLFRGMPDTWRIAAAFALFVAACGWILYFRRTREYFN